MEKFLIILGNKFFLPKIDNFNYKIVWGIPNILYKSHNIRNI